MKIGKRSDPQRNKVRQLQQIIKKHVFKKESENLTSTMATKSNEVETDTAETNPTRETERQVDGTSSRLGLA